jgi:hypothetical protein
MEGQRRKLCFQRLDSRGDIDAFWDADQISGQMLEYRVSNRLDTGASPDATRAVTAFEETAFVRDVVADFLAGVDICESFGAVVVTGGMGKSSFLLPSTDVLIQVREVQKWHEPVVEACRSWSRRGYRIATLVTTGRLGNVIYYAFTWISGRPLEAALSAHTKADQRLLLSAFGARARELCSIPTVDFGEFRCGFRGQFSTWSQFVLARMYQNLTTAHYSGLLPQGGFPYTRFMQRAREILDHTSRSSWNPRPMLVYVDVSLSNALICTGNEITIIDYDYLISGDPLFALARFSIVVDDHDKFRWFAQGFGSELPTDSDLFKIYQILHILELLATPSFGGNQILERRGRLQSSLISMLADQAL